MGPILVGEILVTKVGGSLLPWGAFPGRLRAYLDGWSSRSIVLVVGGGRAADFVRELDSHHGLGQIQSHGLALRSLDLTAHLLSALLNGLEVVDDPGRLGSVWAKGCIPVLAPRWFVDTIAGAPPDPLEASWDVTTDSIAARLADYLGGAELHLLKSVGVGDARSRRVLAERGIVDPAFPRESRRLGRVGLINLRADVPELVPLDA